MTTKTASPASKVPEPTVTRVGRVDYAEFFTIIEHHRYDDRFSLYRIELHYDSLEDEPTIIAAFGLRDLRWASELFQNTLDFIEDYRESQPKSEAEKEAEKLLRAHLERTEAASTD